LVLGLESSSTAALPQGAVHADHRAPKAGKLPVTPERLLADYSTVLNKPPALRWFPDSRSVVFEDAPTPRPASGSEPWIERMNVDTGVRERLVRGSDPKPSPDGSAIAYLAANGSGSALSVYSLVDRTVRIIAVLPAGYDGYDQSFSWSPDSKRIAYAFRPQKPVRKSSANTSEASSVRVIGGLADVPPDSEIRVADLASDKRQRLFSGPKLFANLTWLADGKSIIFTAVGSFEYRSDDVSGEVRAITLSTGDVRTLIENAGVQSLRPVPSPSGKQIAFTYDPSNLPFPFFWNVATTHAQGGGAIHQLTSRIFVSSAPVWSRDERKLYFTGKKHVFSQIYCVTTAGDVRQITSAPRNASNLALSPSGDRLVWSTQDALGRTEVRIARADGSAERVLIDLTPQVKNLALSPVEEIRWKSRDGLEISGLLIRPLGYRPGRRYPLLVNVHGGPVGGVYLLGEILLSSPLEWQMWAAKGYAVLVPDYRSSVVPGWDAVLKAREEQDQSARDMDDIMTGVDEVIRRGVADPRRLALIGHSNGSQMANWIITHTHRFRVAVSYEGWAENYMAYGSGMRVGGNSIGEWYFKGKPWEVPQNYLKNSPAYYVKDVDTPTLFIANDYNGQSGVEDLYHHEFMYTALKKQNVPTELLIYAGEGHVVERPANQKDLLTRIVSWIDRYVSAP
jgi:dipeptidyl aminopeptidase/acylaminoacyl peptidase